MDSKELVRFVPVLRGHSVFSSPPQRPMTSDFEGFLYQILSIIMFSYQKPVFPFSMLSAKQGNYWYHFYYVFGMMWSLTGDWTSDLSHSMSALYWGVKHWSIFFLKIMKYTIPVSGNKAIFQIYSRYRFLEIRRSFWSIHDTGFWK